MKPRTAKETAIICLTAVVLVALVTMCCSRWLRAIRAPTARG